MSILKFKNIKKSFDFLHLNLFGKKYISNSFILQINKNSKEITKIGLTASKQLGNAIKRNRCKRKLRELIKKTLPVFKKKTYHYVIIAKKKCLTQSSKKIKLEIIKILKKLENNDKENI